MSANQQTKNVVDFATYRARRSQRLSPPDPDYGSQGAYVFAALPVMIPMIAWMPVWGLANMTAHGGPADE